MAKLSISEAIRRSPIGKSQFYSKYIDGGLITVSVDNNNKKYIDSSELLRVFGEMKSEQPAEVLKTSGTDSTGKQQTDNQSEVIRLLREQIADLKADKAFQQEHISNLTKRLEAPATAQHINPIKRWWRGLGDKTE